MDARTKATRLAHIDSSIWRAYDADESEHKLPAFSFPGAYAIEYLDREGNSLCNECATSAIAELLAIDPADIQTVYDLPENLPVAAQSTDSWEDPNDLNCDACGKLICPASEWALENQAHENAIPDHDVAQTQFTQIDGQYIYRVVCTCGQTFDSRVYQDTDAYSDLLADALAGWRSHVENLTASA